MTDNEIINDFEKEIKYVRENEKYDDFNPIVDIDLCENVLNIMKLQNEKIKEFDAKLTIQQGLIDYQKAEIERLNEKITAKDESNYYLMGQLRLEKEKRLTAKSEAMKECLARVKNYIKTHCNPYGKPDFDYDTSIKILNFIDNLVKEMTEVETNYRKEDEGNEWRKV